MNAIVIYKSRYGSTKTYAEWIAEELGCSAVEAKGIRAENLEQYDTVIYGGGLYAEVINGVSLITKNMDKLEGKKIVVYSTGLTPPEYREYYDKLVLDKNFKGGACKKIKVFNFLGKMIIEELSIPHKAALKMLKKIMSGKENPTDMERLLIKLCDTSADFTDRKAIYSLVDYVKDTVI